MIDVSPAVMYNHFNDHCKRGVYMEQIEFDKLQEFRRAMTYYHCAIMEMETKFKVLDREFSLAHDRNPIADIRTRLKSPQSIIEKMEKLNLPLSIESMMENLSDVAGVRVICSFPEDVYLLADALLRQDDVKLLARKDYIANPKPNGYRSLHLIVELPIFFSRETVPMKVEIQLRTIAMDSWASLEHQLRYKKDFEFTEHMANELQICANLSAELDARMDALRNLVQENSKADD